MIQRWPDSYVLIRVMKTEMASQEFGVRVELKETHEVSERYPHIRSNTLKSIKEMMNLKAGRPGRGLFFELMPCTLEALTVIKTCCFCKAIPTHWRKVRAKSQVSSSYKQNKPNQKQKQENTRRHPRNKVRPNTFRN